MARAEPYSTLVEIYRRHEGTRGYAAHMTKIVLHCSPLNKDCWQQLLPAVLTWNYKISEDRGLPTTAHIAQLVERPGRIPGGRGFESRCGQIFIFVYKR